MGHTLGVGKNCPLVRCRIAATLSGHVFSATVNFVALLPMAWQMFIMVHLMGSSGFTLYLTCHCKFTGPFARSAKSLWRRFKMRPPSLAAILQHPGNVFCRFLRTLTSEVSQPLAALQLLLIYLLMAIWPVAISGCSPFKGSISRDRD